MKIVKKRFPRRTARAARAEAAVWVMQLHSEARTPQLEAGLREWLEAHPENQREFERVTEVWDLGGAARAESMPRMRYWGHAPHLPRWGLATAAIAACAVGFLGLHRYWAAPTYATAHGEERTIRLTDGSRILLNSDTRLTVEYTPKERRIVLRRGEGLFEVAHDASRPFVVSAGIQQVTAYGTEFEVWYEPARTAITLIRGKIAVSAGKADSLVLRPGERLILALGHSPKLDLPSIAAITAWRRDEVVLDDTPLADVVVEMNRYDDRRLVIDDPSIAAVRLSGVYRTGDTLGFARAVAELHHFTVEEEGHEIHLKRAGS